MKEESTYINGIKTTKVTRKPIDSINFYGQAKASKERIEASQKTDKKLSEKKKQEIIKRFQEQFGSKYIISKKTKEK